MFAGFGDDEDDWEEEEMDLSGWMSRSDLSDFGNVTEEPPVRPRSKPKEPLGGHTSPQMNFTPPMQNMGYVANPVKFAGPFNPLYADDQALWGNPKIVVGAKVAGLGLFGATGLYALGKAMQYRSDREVDGIGEAVREALANNYNLPWKMMLGGIGLYLHPALGMAHGGLASLGLKDTGMSKHTVGKLAIHGLLLGTTVYLMKRE